MILAHKIRLGPTVKQAQFLAKACGVARYTWNWALAECERIYKETGKSANLNDLKKRWNKEKPEWVYESPKDANQQPFAFLKKAWTRFFKGKGKVGRPKFKKKRDGVDSFYLSNDKFSISGYEAQVPIIGKIKTTEKLRFDGKATAGTVSRRADQWFISIQVDVGDKQCRRIGNCTVGVDVGLKTHAFLSTGESIDSPKPLKKLGKQLGRAQKKFARRISIQIDKYGSRIKTDSHRKAKTRLQVQKLHLKISNQRLDFTHKLTTRLCRENQTVVIEDLNVAGMLKNHKLAKAINDVQFGEFRRQLEYKALLYAATLVIADRWFPSSKMCSCCGSKKESLSLSERNYHCEKCGLTLDRDYNAALNLRTLGLRGINAQGPDRLQATGLNCELNLGRSQALVN